MTDNEIIQDLQDLLKNFDGKAVAFMTISFALDLINRQKEEIEALVAGQETLQKNLAKAIKSEAKKEFAERLHEYINGIIEKHEMPMFPFSVAFVSGMETKIDNLVKEMVGETDV